MLNIIQVSLVSSSVSSDFQVFRSVAPYGLSYGASSWHWGIVDKCVQFVLQVWVVINANELIQFCIKYLTKFSCELLIFWTLLRRYLCQLMTTCYEHYFLPPPRLRHLMWCGTLNFKVCSHNSTLSPKRQTKSGWPSVPVLVLHSLRN